MAGGARLSRATVSNPLCANGAPTIAHLPAVGADAVVLHDLGGSVGVGVTVQMYAVTTPFPELLGRCRLVGEAHPFGQEALQVPPRPLVAVEHIRRIAHGSTPHSNFT